MKLNIYIVLTEDTTKTVACALVGSSLDYANSILYGVSGANIHKLQHMQNTIARVVKLSRSNTNVMDILKDLHWLPVWYRIDIKIATLLYKVRSVATDLPLVTYFRIRSDQKSALDWDSHSAHSSY